MTYVHKNLKLFKRFPQLQKHVHTRLSVCKIINLKLFFVNTIFLLPTKIVFACFNKTGTKQDIKK
jgi:hypothetical protein